VRLGWHQQEAFFVVIVAVLLAAWVNYNTLVVIVDILLLLRENHSRPPRNLRRAVVVVVVLGIGIVLLRQYCTTTDSLKIGEPFWSKYYNDMVDFVVAVSIDAFSCNEKFSKI
jgi:hypothetical protein